MKKLLGAVMLVVLFGGGFVSSGVARGWFVTLAGSGLSLLLICWAIVAVTLLSGDEEEESEDE